MAVEAVVAAPARGGNAGGVLIELLVVPDCCNERPAREALSAVLADAGDDAEVRVSVIRSSDEARRRGFSGSPTFLIDGVDPFALPDAPPALSCRLYATPSGLRGLPDLEALREAVLKA